MVIFHLRDISKVTSYVLLTWLLAQVALSAYFFPIFFDALRLGSYHPLFGLWTILSAILLLSGVVAQFRDSTSSKWLVLGSTLSGAFAIYIWSADIACAVLGPVAGACIATLLLEKKRLQQCAVGSILVLLGIVAAVYSATTPVRDAISLVKLQMTDPDSAQFRNVRSTKWTRGDFVCGEVNGKSQFGGYSGYEGFVTGKGRLLLGRGSSDDGAIDLSGNNLTAACLIIVYNKAGWDLPDWLKQQL